MEPASTLKTKWEGSEIKTMLGIVQEMNLVGLLDQKKSRSEVLYKEVEKQLTAKGYEKRFENTIVMLLSGSLLIPNFRKMCWLFSKISSFTNFQQIRNKVKALRSNFNKIVRLNSVSGAAHKTCEYYDELYEIFGHRPAVDYTHMGVNFGITNTVSLEIEESQNEMLFSTPEDQGAEEGATSCSGGEEGATSCSGAEEGATSSTDISSNYGENSDSGKRHSVDLESLFEKQRIWEENMMREQMEAHAKLLREAVQEMGSVFSACVSQLSKTQDTNK
ncbi:uncharacterized protein LOC120330329 isoform X1 [Styela clava]|uniref:uncharacterized protein LOC120330329 isoform X1 n=1 Tax=Styela clava TaxID=7725 RepID=UPI00193A8282|nr:uncharacterized protein LOC120330329 isoform X1 [Styela clava]